MDPFLDLILMDFHGQFVHSWRHTIADGALPKDLCWLDEEHFLVRMGNDAHEPETVDGLLNAHEITHDSVRIFDIRSLPQPVEQKVLPYRIKHFDTAKNDAGGSWLIGTGLVYNQIPFDPLSPVLFNEGRSSVHCYSSIFLCCERLEVYGDKTHAKPLFSKNKVHSTVYSVPTNACCTGRRSLP